VTTSDPSRFAHRRADVEQITDELYMSSRRILAGLDGQVAERVTDRSHGDRAMRIALGIASELGLSRDQLHVVCLGALFHDLGKATVPESILEKPGELSETEREIVQAHSVAGAEIATRSQLLWRAALAIRHHHEWYDGSGYPDGLAGEEIPLEARIVAVADMYEALTTARPYRDALDPDLAMVMIRAESGSHLDPACVSAFERYMAGADADVVPIRR
jgi:putative nucleotidyltransferase with HDIG domain